MKQLDVFLLRHVVVVSTTFYQGKDVLNEHF